MMRAQEPPRREPLRTDLSLRLGATALLVAASCAHAQDLPRAGAAASVQVLHRELVERGDDGRKLLAETGELLRLQGEAGFPLANGGALRGTAAIAAGGLAYGGQTQAGAPVDSDTSQRDLAVALQWRPVGRKHWGEGWFTLEAMQQRRQIASTRAAQGLRETSQLWLAGLRWSHAIDAAGWQWRPSAELRLSVRHRLEVDFGGMFDTAGLAGGRRRELVLAVDVGRKGSPWQWGIAWSHARQSASALHPLTRAGAAAGTVRQPRIEIDDVGLRITRAF